jgi:hypothetical protein
MMQKGCMYTETNEKTVPQVSAADQDRVRDEKGR